MESYSEYVGDLAPWYKEHVDQGFVNDRMQIVALNSEDKLMETVKLIGSDVLPDDQKLTLRLPASSVWASFSRMLSIRPIRTCLLRSSS